MEIQDVLQDVLKTVTTKRERIADPDLMRLRTMTAQALDIIEKNAVDRDLLASGTGRGQWAL